MKVVTTLERRAASTGPSRMSSSASGEHTLLHEYETSSMALTWQQAEALQREKAVDVTPTSGGRWEVTANSRVGTLDVAGVRLLIRPKIRPENLFLLLEPGLPARAWGSEPFEYDTTSDLLPSVVAFFARTVETTLARGVLRSYRTRDESSVAFRGRIDTPGQFRRAGLLIPTACTYDDFTVDISENRALRAAVRRVLRVPGVAAMERGRLKRQLAALEGVSDVHVRPETIDSIHLTRLNDHYGPALRLSRLMLANLTLMDRGGETTASSFTVDMNDLFQRFVTHRLRTALRGKLEVVEEPVVHLGIGRRVPMNPDLIFRRSADGIAYVGDVKYKIAQDARGRSSDYYQLLAYTTALELTEGMLIYCRRQGEELDRTVTVRYSGKRLLVYAVDLTGGASQVEQEIANLAARIWEVASVSRRKELVAGIRSESASIGK
ncbi:McrC family protein [Brachybacterium paraconglomeratum]|uniref:McrC family protein n=1 Tax=Brachybacterium paraconglomeratum TaxID=173362 RepID=UPI003879C6CC